MKDDDDKDLSLHELSLDYGASIISQLVNIGNERNQQRHVKFLPFVSHLQCLRPEGTQLLRTSINAFNESQYVALSYTWNPSEYEDPCNGRYRVEGWDDIHLKPSAVRNCVLDRVLGYMRYAKVKLLWIDADCIRQDTCGVAACTSHHRCIQKRDALQAMDLVYQLSKHPVALLARPLQMKSELDLLKHILSGNLVEGNDNIRLSRATTIHKAKKALRLLREITRDIWWGRAWTFQENYRGGQRMQLLIRHDQSLEQQKRHHRIFGKIRGELCVQSVTFSREATRLCMALRSRIELPPDDICRINDVLRAAGRYTEMLLKSSAMTPTIVADIEARGLLKPWDRLAILANCCQYPIRLDYEALNKQRRSLSLSTLAMCLLNGEILDNNDCNQELVASLTTSKFLAKKLFKAFSAPEDDTRELTFNKGCRLTDVKLTTDGILTKGHLWKLSRVIDTSKFKKKLPWINNPRGRLTLNKRKRLLQLVFRLNNLGHRPLANRIDEYLADDAKSNAQKDFISFTEMYLHHMAAELAAAIRARRKLRLGSIWDPTGRLAPYCAVFVWSDKDEDEGEAHPPPAFVFTSAWSCDPGSKTHKANDIDRHVSLEVSLEKSPDGASVPHLRVHRWLLGMCFFDGYPRTKVVFPWPRELQSVKP
ncbi:hypothetical protein THARTR1_00621 [Trichoderma harzianum]|uniref:Heterokaryon incompatibility domain-containing protein n=1 Tax=Trichoderma harzianum TaxID=5544 RepID=A0A2K0UPQ9_TRIHA|nr:hypothetical protein THARTR1_00621 [Trichoderma harzianum]